MATAGSVPAVFDWLQEQEMLSTEEMYRVLKLPGVYAYFLLIAGQSRRSTSPILKARRRMLAIIGEICLAMSEKTF